MPLRDELGEVLGFPVRVRGDAAWPIWRHLRWRSNQRALKGRPAVTVEFVRDAGHTNARAARCAIRGSTFLLDLKKNVLYLEPPVSVQAWIRTILFVLGLLAEHHGPKSIAGRHTRGWSPLLLHSSAICARRGALIFCGHSTFGKSTIATKLLRAYPLINEDLNILLVGPFGTNSKKPDARILVDRRQRTSDRLRRLSIPKHTLPIRGLFWLKKATYFKLEPKATAESVADLLHPIFDLRRPENAAHRLGLLRALLRFTACKRLYFRKARPPLIRMLRTLGYL